MSIKDELEIIEKRTGTLRPVDVVKYAENPNTELHSKFVWDDSKAAHAYRIVQAQHIIRVTVSVIDDSRSNKMQRVYVSLPSDRTNGGGVYRTLVSVMSDDTKRSELLKLAMKEAIAFKEKYNQLEELSELFLAIDNIQAEKVA